MQLQSKMKCSTTTCSTATGLLVLAIAIGLVCVWYQYPHSDQEIEVPFNILPDDTEFSIEGVLLDISQHSRKDSTKVVIVTVTFVVCLALTVLIGLYMQSKSSIRHLKENEELHVKNINDSDALNRKLLKSEERGKNVEEEYKSKLQEMREDYEMERTEMRSRYETMLKTERDEKEKIREAYQQAQQRILALQANEKRLREVHQKENSVLQSEITGLKRQIDWKEEELKLQRDDYQKLSASKEEKIEALVKETRSKHSVIEALKEENCTLVAENTGLQAELHSVKEQVMKHPFQTWFGNKASWAQSRQSNSSKEIAAASNADTRTKSEVDSTSSSTVDNYDPDLSFTSYL